MIGITVAASPASGQQLTPKQLQQLLQMQQEDRTSPDDREADLSNTEMRGIGGPLLDRPISRTEYRLGPGDLLTLSVLGYTNNVFSLAITPEGTVVIPTVGVVPLSGLNLNEATRRARREVLRYYPDSEVEISLAAVRSFHIFVIGAVDDPGIRPANAVTRVSEVVPAADEDGVIYRNIKIHRGGDTIRVDLSRFVHHGDLTHNPYLREGDVIRVPKVDETVTIAGEVEFPGTYEYRSAETLAELISMGNGDRPFLSRAADTLLLVRFSDDPRGEIWRISRDDAAGVVGNRMPLHPFDAVFVPRLAHHKEQTSATIQGEVMKPGVYPIRQNVTTVRDLVEMAGGFTSEASPSEAVLRRERNGVTGGPAQTIATIPPELLSRNEQRILQVTSSSDPQNLVVDLSGGNHALDLAVEDGDLFHIPKRREEVVVLGAVRRPGLVNYSAGQSIEYFVELAGGYMRRADRGDIVVLRTRSGAQLHRKDLDRIEPGDQIVIPFKERTTFLERVQTTQGIINTVSGLVLTIVGLERLWDSITN